MSLKKHIQKRYTRKNIQNNKRRKTCLSPSQRDDQEHPKKQKPRNPRHHLKILVPAVIAYVRCSLVQFSIVFLSRFSFSSLSIFGQLPPPLSPVTSFIYASLHGSSTIFTVSPPVLSPVYMYRSVTSLIRLVKT